MKLNSVILILAVITTLFAGISVSAEETEEYFKWGDYKYITLPDEYDFLFEGLGGTAIIMEYCGYDEKVTVPDVIDSYTVSCISSNAFSKEVALKEVTVPDSVIYISYEAFNECESLTTVNLGSGIEDFSEAFVECPKLSIINISEDNKKLKSVNGLVYSKDGEDFLYCPSGVSGTVNVASGTEYIEYYAFYYCDKITKINLPDSVKEISSFAFYQCDSLKSIKLSANLEAIPYDMILYCKSLKSITVPKGVKEIESQAFAGIENLESIYVSSENKYFSAVNGVLYNKTKTELLACPTAKTGSLTIPKTVKTIEEYAFSGSNLSKLGLPASVTSIKEGALDGMAKLESVTVNSANTKFSSLNGILYNKAKTKLILTPSLKSGKITVPSTVAKIDDYAFLNCKKITDIVLPENLKNIGVCAFSGCNSLTQIVIPASVKVIGVCAFEGCKKLKKVTFNEGLEEISEYAFANTPLQYVKFPDSLKKIEYSAFMNCKKLKTVEFSKNLKTISAYAFRNCTALTSVSLPKGITTIESGTFYGCTSVKYVYIPSTVTYIGDLAFGKLPSDAKIHYGGTNFEKVDYKDSKEGINAFDKTFKIATKKSRCTSHSFGDDIYCDKCNYCTFEPKLVKKGSKCYYYNNAAAVKTTGLKKIGGKWYYIKNGVWNKSTTLVKKNGKWHYVKNGKADYTFTGVVKVNSKTRFIKKGILTSNLDKPTVKIKKISNGINISWNKVECAKGYTVYRKSYKNGKWSDFKAIKQTSALKYTDKTAKKGVKYKYAVKAYNGKIESKLKTTSTVKR